MDKSHRLVAVLMFALAGAALASCDRQDGSPTGGKDGLEPQRPGSAAPPVAQPGDDTADDVRIGPVEEPDDDDAFDDNGEDDPSDGDTCGDGEIVRLATDELGARYVALDGTHVYWLHGEDRALRRVLKTGGAAETVVEVEGESVPFLIDAGAAYVSQIFDTDSVTSRIDVATGTRERISDDAGRLFGVDDAYLYLTLSTSVLRIPKDGGDAETLHEMDASDEVLDAALTGGTILVSGRGELLALRKTGGEAERVAALEGGDVAVDGSRAFVVTANGRVQAVDLATGEVTVLAEGTLDGPEHAFGIVAGFGTIYWAEMIEHRDGLVGRIRCLDQAGGDPDVVFESRPVGFHATYDLALDASGLYWAYPPLRSVYRFTF